MKREISVKREFPWNVNFRETLIFVKREFLWNVNFRDTWIYVKREFLWSVICEALSVKRYFRETEYP